MDLSKDTGLPSSSSSDSSSSSSSSSSDEGEGEGDGGEGRRYSSDSSHDSQKRTKKRQTIYFTLPCTKVMFL